MRATSYDHYADDNSALQVGEVPDPKVGPGAVLVKVRAAGVNPVDWKVMTGGLDDLIDTTFPVIPGWDVAGEVVALGPDTPEFSVGDEVISYARKHVIAGGTFAELVAVPAADLAPKPASLSWEEAGGLPLAGLTALAALRAVGIEPSVGDERPAAGTTVLLHGAAGGVGGFGVQLARDAGARVIATASERNHDYLRELGAEPVVYGDGLAQRVRELAPDGVDAVVDFVGGVLEVTLAVLKEGAPHASIVDGAVDEQGGRLVWVRPDAAGLTLLGQLADQGRLSVDVAGTYGLEQVGEAFDASRGGHVRGKLVIVP